MINLTFSNARDFLYSEDRKNVKVFKAHINRKNEEAKNFMGKTDKITNSTLWALDETQLIY